MKKEIAAISVKEVEEKIEVRSPLSIYAFRTNTIPSYLKVGDTFRPVDTRITEWSKKLKETIGEDIEITKEASWVAMLEKEGVYFRDYSLHKIFDNWHKARLSIEEQKKYSKEFFSDIETADVEKAIEIVKTSYSSEETRNNFDYYKISDRRPSGFKYERNENWELRDNQKKVVDNFEQKVRAYKEKQESEIKLLMYAVMRFGKSFTAISCAERMKYKKVLVVSAKAEVAGEWKKTVEKPKCFEGFKFLTDINFRSSANAIEEELNKDAKCVVVFLTLQNLSGKASNGEDIKERLEKAYSTEYDLIIVDETHYGAWAEKYGAPLKASDKKSEDLECVEEEIKEQQEFIKETKKLKSKVKLHLSGTPYSLLYENEFNEENTIATCQFSDILEAKEAWNEEHFEHIEEEVINPFTGRKYEEYDNPYFGFPKMLRFGFNLPSSARKKLNEFKKEGVSWSLRDFLSVESKTKRFRFEEEVKKLLKIIDGTEHDSGILSFLNIEKIKKNDVCKHIVMALPFKKSCDAMEKLLTEIQGEFINLCNYKVLNIAGTKPIQQLKTVDSVKKAISECERNNQKTITLTVNRMLTGVTVKEWDTMIMLKSTKSAQEYDQAIFRIQNQYVREEIDEKGNVLFKEDMKPQTILVDFDAVRVLEVQGRAISIINNFIRHEGTLDSGIEREIKYLPTMVYNGDKLVEVTPNNILDVLIKYNQDKSIMDIASKIQITESIKNNPVLLEFIKRQSAKGVSDNTIKMDSHKSKDTSDIDPDDGDTTTSGASGTTSQKNQSSSIDKDLKDIDKKYQNYIAKIYFYAFLTKSRISSLQELLGSLENDIDNKETNHRICDNLDLNENFVKELISVSSNIYLDDINKEIIQVQRLARDENLTEEQRIDNAMKRFSVIGEAEVVTSQKLCKELLETIGEEVLIKIVNTGGKILDIASKTGEFSIALYRMLSGKVDKEKLKKAICAIPTSSCTYEFTRKAFENAGLCIKNLSTNITSYSLLTHKKLNKKGKETKELDYDKICSLIKDKFKEGENEVKFEAVVGNPPYQETIREASKGNNKNTSDIYQHFQEVAIRLAPLTCMIYPAKDFQRGKKNTLDEKLINLRIYNGSNRNGEKHIPHEDSVFGDAVRRIPGDVGIYVYDSNNPTATIIYQGETVERTDKVLPLIKEFFGVAKKLAKDIETFKFSDIKKVCESNFVERNKGKTIECRDRKTIVPNGYTKVLTNNKEGSGGIAKWYYIKTDSLDRVPNSNRFKVVIASARLNEAFANPNNIEILDKNESFGRTKYCIYDTDILAKAEACKKYFSTCFAQCINLMTPEKFLYYLPDFDSIYTDIDWSKSIPEIDQQLYAKYNLTEEEISFIESMIKPME